MSRTVCSPENQGTRFGNLRRQHVPGSVVTRGTSFVLLCDRGSVGYPPVGAARAPRNCTPQIAPGSLHHVCFTA
eukprot:2923982-Pyramimonas_sp.AAC.1